MHCSVTNSASRFLFNNAIRLTLTEKVIILQFHRAIKKKEGSIQTPANEILLFQDQLEAFSLQSGEAYIYFKDRDLETSLGGKGEQDKKSGEG